VAGPAIPQTASRSREVARRAIQADIARTAEALFVRQGFEQTTVEEIAAAVGMSSRSISRYFPSKEDMVVGPMLRIGDEVAAALEDRPPEEAPWEALRHALEPALQAIADAPARAEMLAKAPALRAAMHQKQAHWTELLVPRLAARLQGSAASRHLQAHAIVAAAFSCLDVAVAEWRNASVKQPIGALMDAAIKAVRS
jgi:AcrR family transcriptional regulator